MSVPTTRSDRAIDLSADAVAITRTLIDIQSVSGTERELADAVELALRDIGPLKVERLGHVVLARTEFGRPGRVVLAGHLDTVPIKDNWPSRVDGDRIYGCGASDMKAGLALMLRAAYAVGTGELQPEHDLSWVFYDCEEVEPERNGLFRLTSTRPDALTGDLAVLLEPTNGVVEGGCQGNIWAVVRTHGERAHSARSWLGRNAIHAAGPVLERLTSYPARTVDIDGLTFREGLSAVKISGGVAGNVIPDECTVTVNFRYAPDRSEEEASAHIREVFDSFDVEIVDVAPAARPGLDQPIAKAFIAAVGGAPQAKLGWTDVARFAGLGIPALNFGPGDPNLAHAPGEYALTERIVAADAALLGFLRGA